MTTYTYNGTSFDDYISTYDLQEEYSWVTSGFEVYGLSGDDNLTISFIGRNGVDFINGGVGDDFMAIHPSYLSPLPITNHALFYGESGTDRVYLSGDYSTSNFSINEGQIEFTVYGSAGEMTQVIVSPTVEIISFGDFYYLTEDIWNGRIRAVDFSEVYARAYNENSDWYAFGLDTYSEYHSAPTPAPIPTPTPEPTPAPIPTPTPELTSATTPTETYYEWGQFTKGEDYYYEAEVQPGEDFQIYFTVSDSQTLYAYFDLYNFTDDLDLYLYRDDETDYLGDPISSSLEEGAGEEVIFKGLTPGDYILQIDHYDDLDGSNENSKFRIDFDSTHFYENSTLPDDTLFASQWHLLNTGQGAGVDNEDITAPEAWRIINGSPNVDIAVIDGGIQLDHPDLVNNIWRNAGEIPGNNIDDDGNGYVDDINGWNFANNNNSPYVDLHGTHVAGIIGAEGNNSKGISGVTWDTNLMSLDVFGSNKYASDSNILAAIYYAVDNGAEVINMSIGELIPYTTLSDYRLKEPTEYSKYYEALKYATDRGVTVVIAAGNEDADVGTHLPLPAAFSAEIDGVISVAAVANTGDITSYSNYGSLVTIAAPGGDDNGTSGSNIISTAPNSGYEEISGTSMASPIVAGAAALIKAVNPRLQPNDIENILTNSADKYRELSTLIEDGNYLNLKDAVVLAKSYKPTPAPTPEPTSATTPQPSSSDPIIGTAGKDKLKAKGRSTGIYGMGGNDKIIGSNGNDILDGGFGNDKIKGKKGADIYILSPGKDKFQGFKIKEGDTIQIDSSIDFEVSGSRKLSKIEHDMGVTTVKKVSPTDLESVIQVV